MYIDNNSKEVINYQSKASYYNHSLCVSKVHAYSYG